MGDIVIRQARADEAGVISALMMRSKAYWGYDQAFLDACRPLLTMYPEAIESDHVFCAEADGVIAGISHLKRLSDDETLLDDLFVDPAFIGNGVGGLLWQHAVQVAASLGAKAIVFSADPYARPFYEHMGAIVIGEEPSSAGIPGRMTPRMRFDLPAHVEPI